MKVKYLGFPNPSVICSVPVHQCALCSSPSVLRAPGMRKASSPHAHVGAL